MGDVARQVDAAHLILGIRKDSEDAIGDPFQAVGDKQKHLFDTTLSQVLEYFFRSIIPLDANGNIDGFFEDRVALEGNVSCMQIDTSITLI